MSRFDGNYRPVKGRSVRALAGLVAATALLAGGCSSGITRFDYPSSGLTETGSSGPPRTGPAGGGYGYAPPAGSYGNGNGYGQPPAGSYGNGYGAPQPGYGGGYGAPAGGGYGNGYRAPAYGGYGNEGGSYGNGHAPPPPSSPYGNSTSAPPPPAGSYGAPPAAPYGGVSSAPQSGAYGSNVSVAALPKSDGPPRPAPAPASVMSQPAAAAAPPVTPVARATPASAAPTGEEVEVQQGDTVYNISQRHRVSMSELIRVNGLNDLNLKPGQKLRLPAGAKSVAKAAPRAQPAPPAAQVRPVAEAPKAAPVVPVVPAAAAPIAAAPAAAQPVAAAPVAWTDSYTIKSGDSLYSVARRRGVTVAELQRANGITDVRKVMPGAVIKVPPESTESRQAAAVPTPSSPSVTPTVSSQPTKSAVPSVTVGLDPQTAAGPRPTVINAPRVAAVDTKGTATDVPLAVVAPKQEPEQPKATASGDLKLRWPVKGRVISKFGPQSDGTQNDGVNVAVPLGAEVLAAESGVVAYAGSEVRGYGNLVLVRHDNGWVTAYAHNDELMVQRGDRVRRGQALAKAGRTGNVDQPQVHFELRQGPKPVDPTPYMERM